MSLKKTDQQLDSEHLWHPYASMLEPQNCSLVRRGTREYLQISSNQWLIDGMSSWWTTIHGYNHPVLNRALSKQIKKISHVMFGGLTHDPAIQLGRELLRILPPSLECIFFADSGSVAVEVSLKIALQYWQAKNKPQKKKFIALEYAYHGDTFGAMSVCDPENSMHHLYKDFLNQNFFAKAPKTKFHHSWDPEDVESLQALLEEHHKVVAAVIVEPIVQGAGGMRFYHPNYLNKTRELCDLYGVLLIADEIATGFGRTGKLFACEQAQIIPDIICIGKALTGGYLSLGATVTTRKISNTIGQANPGCLMHGPTFMANPLACSVALSNLKLLRTDNWQQQVAKIETNLIKGLMPLRQHPAVQDVRVLGAIGVVELKQPIDVNQAQQFFIQEKVWIRPFGKLIYLMPAYIIQPKSLTKLMTAIKNYLNQLEHVT